MKTLAAVAIILIGLALVAGISQRHNQSGRERNLPAQKSTQATTASGASSTADASPPTWGAVVQVDGSGDLPAQGQANSNPAPAAVEAVAAIYRRVVEKVEAAQKLQ